jgi:hypothetical protein
MASMCFFCSASVFDVNYIERYPSPFCYGLAKNCRSKRGFREQRWFTISKQGAPRTPEAARDEAQRLLGEAAHKSDPPADKPAKRTARTVAELCDSYLADAKAGRLLTRRKIAKRASTVAIDCGRIERHIKALLGHRTVARHARGYRDALA